MCLSGDANGSRCDIGSGMRLVRVVRMRSWNALNWVSGAHMRATMRGIHRCENGRLFHDDSGVPRASNRRSHGSGGMGPAAIAVGLLVHYGTHGSSAVGAWLGTPLGRRPFFLLKGLRLARQIFSWPLERFAAAGGPGRGFAGAKQAEKKGEEKKMVHRAGTNECREPLE